MNSTTAGPAVVESQQGALVGMQVFLLMIALIFCALRIQSRIVIVRSLGPDDYLMIAATVFSIALTINAGLGSSFGWGKHLVDVAPADYSNVLLVGWIAQLLFTFTTSLVKISISTFYLRLANTKTYRIIIYCTIGWLTLWCIAFVFVVIFQCSPVDAYWHPVPNMQNPKCIHADPPLLVNGITNIINDLFVYILPMPMLWRIQLPRKQRIGLLALFGIGSLVCIAGAVRSYYSVMVNDSFDPTWGGFELWTWEAVEVDLGIACACAPAVKPLLIRWFPRIMERVFGRTSDISHGFSARNGISPGNNGTFIPMNSPSMPNAGQDSRQGHRVQIYGGWRPEESSRVPAKGFSRSNKNGESEESLTKP